MHKPISKNPLITALSAEYAQKIRAVKEGKEAKIESLYKEFTWKYECLKRIIEAQEDSKADSLDSSSFATSRSQQSEGY